MKRLLFSVLLFIALLSPAGHSQVRLLGGGINTGIGYFSNASPSVTSYICGAYLDLKYTSLPDLSFKLQGLYSRDIDILFPENRTGKYYPYLYGGALTAMTAEELSPVFSLEYGGGIVLLRDKTFSDYDNYDPGAQLNAEVLMNVGTFTDAKLELGLAAMYGQTFGKTNPAYLFWSLDLRYRVL
jgi:hypothetical protein